MLRSCVLLAALLTASPVLAQKDSVAGSDHPLVGRYEGARLVGYVQKRFDARTVVIGGRPDASLLPQDKQTIEGKVTVLAYNGPAQATSLEVFRNYQAALKAKGFTQSYGCENTQGQPKKCPSPRDLFYAVGDPLQPGVIEGGNCWMNQRYGLFRKTGAATIMLFVEDCKNAQYHPKALISVVEPAAMATGQIKAPTAQEISQAFADDGKIALYGIFFDTAKADMKPESKPTLDSIAALLKSRPQLAVVIAGYTDNVGGFDANVALSKRRADAVVAALVKDYQIAPARLTAFGAGMTGPRAPNIDDSGRAKNRRVELIPR
jgi:OmpA-OmpF porin, OOP family